MATNDVVVTGIQDDAEIKRNNDAALQAERKASELRRKKAEQTLKDQQEKTAQIDVIGPALRSFDAAQAAQAARVKAEQAARDKAEQELKDQREKTAQIDVFGPTLRSFNSAQAAQAAQAKAERSRAELQSLPITVDQNDSSRDNLRAQSLQGVLERAKQRAEQHAILMQKTSREAGYGGAMPHEGESTEIEWITGRAAPKGSYAAERKSADAAAAEAAEGVQKFTIALTGGAIAVANAVSELNRRNVESANSAQGTQANLGDSLRTAGISGSGNEGLIQKYQGGLGSATASDMKALAGSFAARKRALGPGFKFSGKDFDTYANRIANNELSLEDAQASIAQTFPGRNDIGPTLLGIDLSAKTGATAARAKDAVALRANAVSQSQINATAGGADESADRKAAYEAALNSGSWLAYGLRAAVNVATLGQADPSVFYRSGPISAAVNTAVGGADYSSTPLLKEMVKSRIANERTAAAATHPLNTSKGRN